MYLPGQQLLLLIPISFIPKKTATVGKQKNGTLPLEVQRPFKFNTLFHEGLFFRREFNHPKIGDYLVLDFQGYVSQVIGDAGCCNLSWLPCQNVSSMSVHIDNQQISQDMSCILFMRSIKQ